MDFQKAIFIREFESYLLDLFKEGKLNGTVHTCVGQETIPVMISEYFKKGDQVFSNHRGHGHFLSFGGDAKSLLAEMLGKKTGVSKGIGGSQHLHNENFISNGIQGGMTPISVGYSYANKLNGSDNISIVFIGDGTLGEGILYEALNLAALVEAPVLFVLENNGYAQSTAFKYIKRGEISDRVKGFGVEYRNGNIWDLNNLDMVMKDSVNACRSGKPVFVEVECYRLNSHSKGDDNRDMEEVRRYSERDPINVFCKEHSETAQRYSDNAKEMLTKYLSEIEQDEEIGELKKHSYINNIEVETAKYTKLDADQGKRINKLINEALEAILSNPSSIFIGEDIMELSQYTPGRYGGAFKVSQKLSDIFPQRVFNTPICEAGIIGFILGAALNGYKSVAEIMFGDFLTLGLDQILQHASKFPEMYGKEILLPAIIRTPMGGRRGYGPTHSQNIEKHFFFIPNVDVIALNSFINPKSVYNTLSEKIRNLTLVVEDKILYTKEIASAKTSSLFDIQVTSEDFPTLIFTPKDATPNITIFCYGGMLDELLACTEQLFYEEIAPEIIVPVQIIPLNLNPLLKSIKKTNKILIIEEGSKFGALSSEILSFLAENKISLEKCRRISNESIIACAKTAEMNSIPNSTTIAKQITNILQND